MLTELVFFLLVPIAGTAGELCMARAMRGVGEVTHFRPQALIGVVWRALSVVWTWVGLGLMTLAFFALLAVLAVENVSFAVPVTALSYAVGALGGRVFLHERVTPTRWAGVLLVCFGVTLVLVGQPWG